MGMTRVDLLKGHLALHEKIRDWDNFVARVKGLVTNSAKRRPKVKLTELDIRRQKWARRLVKPLLGRPSKVVLGSIQWLLKRTARSSAQRLRAALDPRASKAILDIVQHTIEHAPWMWPGKIVPLIAMQLRQIELLHKARPTMLEQIERESSPGFQLQFAERVIVIPEAFNATYKKLFPDFYSRVQEQLNNKTRVEEALIEIFTQFLTRWGGNLDRLEDYQHADLEATCDAVIADENRHPHIGLVTLGPLSTSDFRKSKLPEEILHSVEQELRLRPGRGKDEVLVHAGAF
jgi:hypothetical protein